MADRLIFPDHHAYGAAEATALGEAARGVPLITTEKDFVKLAGRPGLEELRALRVTLEVDDADRLVALLENG